MCSMSNFKKQMDNDSKDDFLDKSGFLIRESMKSERNGGKSEEDWRRRTIIVEKKDGSYGFTLQSYGIHYRKEQEIEVITYVDIVEAEGPAAAAGMREGDVILSINGTNVERADHATVVNTINACQARIRMVVIFEDCVHKVELHLKHINLQRTLQCKLREFKQLTICEKQLFDGNWKTHSLPSQKKKISSADVMLDTKKDMGCDNISSTYCRPTLSSGNVNISKLPQSSLFMHQYIDPRLGACLMQQNMHQGSLVITVGSPRKRAECRRYVIQNTEESHRPSEPSNLSNKKHVLVHKPSHGCTPCMPTYSNQDDNSLEAYDLASPCCDPHCVPNSRKKVRRKKECSKEYKKKGKYQQVDKPPQKSSRCFDSRPKKGYSSRNHSSLYCTTESTQTSECSLPSYATSKVTVPCDNLACSCSTSLSSDTLFWDNERSEPKFSPKIQYQSSHQHYKPKSWDNLSTKAFAGYGFENLNTESKQPNRAKHHERNHCGRSTHNHQSDYQCQVQEKHNHHHSATSHHRSMYVRSRSHCMPTKSTETLYMIPKYQLESSTSENRQTCDSTESFQYYRMINIVEKQCDNDFSNYSSRSFIYPTHSSRKKEANVSSEITRL